ncbi:hypothetical protein [Streptomyces mexicanus]|uniref:Uncharacterized protein n=1 Tax=Streptomyces mexicanus TaxID=178566 RepID=A0A7X1I620_9ACTN|nr:hypothetical protein [Streptomyces mexicanus]MBC2869430.1 hypothetical protein [Streptomyces mexicanus]
MKVILALAAEFHPDSSAPEEISYGSKSVEEGDMDRYVIREVRPVPGARVEAGMIGPIRLVIGPDGPPSGPAPPSVP